MRRRSRTCVFLTEFIFYRLANLKDVASAFVSTTEVSERHRSCASMRPRHTVHPVHKKPRRGGVYL